MLDKELEVDPNIEIIVPGNDGTDLTAPPTIDLNTPPAITP